MSTISVTKIASGRVLPNYESGRRKCKGPRKRLPYSKPTHEQRMRLVEYVKVNGMTVGQASVRVGIKYSTGRDLMLYNEKHGFPYRSIEDRELMLEVARMNE